MLQRPLLDQFQDELFKKKQDESLQSEADLINVVLSNNDVSDEHSSQSLTTGRTPFTKGSRKAWNTVISNSVFHTASTPLALMQLKVIQDLPLGVSGLLLLASWAGAASLNSWANYYKYIERSTSEFGLEYVTDFNFIPEPGILYFFNVLEEQRDSAHNGLHYMIYTEENGVIRYDAKRVESLYDDELKGLIRTRQFDQLKKADSEIIKANVELNHYAQPMADADFVPGKRTDSWFFLLCCISMLPALSAGTILGYTSTAGQSESNRVFAAAWFALFNYIKNLLCDMPVIANAYGKNEELGNMGPIALQPGTGLVINAFVLGILLRNIAPAFLAFTTLAGLANDKFLPPYSGFIGGLILFPFIASSFLLFTMLALQKLNLQKGLKDSPNDSCFQKILFSKSAITDSLGLEHSFANSKNPIIQFLGEILGGRFITVSGPLRAGLSPQSDATLITSMKAFGDFALIFGPTFEVVASFLTFFFNDSANGAKPYMTLALLVLGACASVLGAITQWPNFVECCELRQNQLGLNKHRKSITTDSNNDAQVDSDDNVAVRLVGSNNQAPTIKALRDGGLSMSHTILYGTLTRKTNDNPNPIVNRILTNTSV